MKRMKFYVAAASAILLFSTLFPAEIFAENPEINVSLNGNLVSFSQTPILVNDRTLVPVRSIFEDLGAEVLWEEGSNSVTITKNNQTISLSINCPEMQITNDGETQTITLDTPPQLIADCTMLPLRAICEALGAEVTWDESTQTANIITDTALPALIDNTKWNYQSENDVYWQTGISYCANPADSSYETLGIFIPGTYVNAQDNGDGTFTLTLDSDGTLGGYTAETAPIVIPVNTPGYSAMKPPSGYDSSTAPYTSAGFVCVSAGCRGRDAGAPAGVTDLKAAVRYLQYAQNSLPGSTDRIFTFGMSGGGAQSALMGATGDSALYTPYLEAIGAVSGVSDAVAGSMCWCPITSLDYANEAYEWNMGLTRTNLDSQTQALSDGMAEAFAHYLNALELKDENGNVLSLTESETGIYMSGSYYDYLKNQIEQSLNNFLSDTEFPYTPQSRGMGGPGGMTHDGQDMPRIEDIDGIVRDETEDKEQVSVTYQTAQEYIDSLNQGITWISYDPDSNTATISSVEDFVKTCKKAGKSVGAFDDLNATQGENILFGYGDGQGTHFDPVMAQLLTGTEYAEAYQSDLLRTDFLGNTVQYRMNMYNPMYYLVPYYDGFQTSNVAKYWRIRTGINQSDTALTTEVNLALALENYSDLQVDFATVWGQGHTQAERSGDSDSNFIAWVNSCLASEE